MTRWILPAALALAFASIPPAAAQDADAAPQGPDPRAGMSFRLIGPSYNSGRISDFAVHPDGAHHYYFGTASGGLWKTENGGISFDPLFDRQDSYAIGVVELDPSNSNIVWAGTGENNAQRSVAFGDGVYKSLDGGKSWQNMGLKDSGHISQIWIHPDDGDTVLVAAQGPLWSDGGDRGLYKTTDGGKSWTRILAIDPYTGINEFVVHPDDPDTILASSYQRRRHLWTLINGGPGSGIHKSSDGGKSWREITSGLPSGDKGRIGLAMAPSQPDTVYAIVEALPEQQGVFRTTNFGESWEKRSSHMTTSPQYYNELVVDPNDPDTVYSLDTRTTRSTDGGKSFKPLSTDARHVDDHALWIDPDNSDHLLIGGDGGIYESWDGGQKWRHAQNLPIVQFYRIAVDNDEPFYNVCGGTQDNNSLCGPSRTTTVHGITNADWHIVLGGDGYKPQIDPTDPNIVYAQYQYGGLARHDRRTQEVVFIAPQAQSGEDAYKFNWNTPLLISPHNPKRLYYGAEYLFRSDDRGDNWQKISPDLTAQIDRNKLEVMGRVWSVDAIAKNASTSKWGSLIAVDESPLQEGLLYTGSDDGVISVSEDGGESWTSRDLFPGVPQNSYVEDIIASRHDVDTAYAVFDNHKRGDFTAYVLVTRDRGQTWRPLGDALPDRGPAHTIAEDHEDPNLLFLGTEFGVHFSTDGGQSWTRFTKLPTQSVRDLVIQRRENDLVVGTFGRGIYILDDYSPLRTDRAALEQGEATLFPVREALLYIPGSLYGGSQKGYQGDQFWAADNPEFGAHFTYYLPDGYKTAKAARRAEEAKRRKAGKDNPYPSWDDLRAEDREDAPVIAFTIYDSEGDAIRTLTGSAGKGLHKLVWDLRLDSPEPVREGGGQPRIDGPLALPGDYTVRMFAVAKDAVTELGEAQSFRVEALERSPEATDDRAALLSFQMKTVDLYRQVALTAELAEDMDTQIDEMKASLARAPQSTEEDYQRIRQIETDLADARIMLDGDQVKAGAQEPTPVSIRSRIFTVLRGHWGSQGPVPGLHRKAYDIAESELAQVHSQLKEIRGRMQSFQGRLDELGAPPIPGALPEGVK